MNARKHATVIGGSIAGLWAARVLSDHFEQVTVIDRDHFPETPEARKGVPQGRQVHVLLVRGQQIMDQLFPGITAELEADGVTMLRWTEDTYSYGTNGKWSAPFPFGYRTMACSRILLEWHIRRRLAQYSNVRFLEGRQVVGLLTNPDQTQVTGVRLNATGAERASVGEETLAADLVVDASGRESHAPEWLTALGYTAPEEVVLDSHVGYATRFYQPPAGFQARWKSLLIQSRSGNTSRSGLIYPIENGQWMALMVGVNVELPADDDAYLDFARNLPQPDMLNALKASEPLSPVYRYQRTANQRRHYEALDRLPESFILMGDAVCAFNPVFGQGMSVSAIEALMLGDELKRGENAGFAARFQKNVGKIVATPWQLATSEDARNLKPGETVSLGTRLLRFYMDHLLGLVSGDPQVGRAFFDVMHLIKPPTVLFAPPVALKVFRSMLTKRQPLLPTAPQVVAESH